jgi:2-hydroxy-3-keto-5-methylthiopentenyl-1-phosphate phosphatase
MDDLIHPFYYQIIRREGTTWFFKEEGEVFYNPHHKPVDLKNPEQQYGLTKGKIVIELFRVNGGKPGYYLANMRDRLYYYCGDKWEDVRATLLNLDIGRREVH